MVKKRGLKLQMSYVYRRTENDFSNVLAYHHVVEKSDVMGDMYFPSYIFEATFYLKHTG